MTPSDARNLAIDYGRKAEMHLAVDDFAAARSCLGLAKQYAIIGLRLDQESRPVNGCSLSAQDRFANPLATRGIDKAWHLSNRPRQTPPRQRRSRPGRSPLGSGLRLFIRTPRGWHDTNASLDLGRVFAVDRSDGGAPAKSLGPTPHLSEGRLRARLHREGPAMSTIIIPDSIRSARGEAPKPHTPFAILAMAIACWVPVVVLIWAVC